MRHGLTLTLLALFLISCFFAAENIYLPGEDRTNVARANIEKLLGSSPAVFLENGEEFYRLLIVDSSDSTHPDTIDVWICSSLLDIHPCGDSASITSQDGLTLPTNDFRDKKHLGANWITKHPDVQYIIIARQYFYPLITRGKNLVRQNTDKYYRLPESLLKPFKEHTFGTRPESKPQRAK